MKPHPDDQFHPPASDDPYWTETCWFTFSVPERRLSGQLYPFFRRNQNITAGGAFFWDDTGCDPWNIRYGKNFWHLPLPEDADLSDIYLPNGIRYRCIEPLAQYQVGYRDPDGDDLQVDITFTGLCAPNYLGESHLDQPGRYTGTIVLEGEEIAVDSYGFRDRSWGLRSQFGEGLPGDSPRGGYSYATASPQDGFHMISMVFGGGESNAQADSSHADSSQTDSSHADSDAYSANNPFADCLPIHGHLLRDGVYSKLVPASGKRIVLERGTGDAPTKVCLEATDELGRSLVAVGECVNKLGVHLNPNLFTWNCLTRWQWGETQDTLDRQGWGEDHDNWGAATARRFFRRLRALRARA